MSEQARLYGAVLYRLRLPEEMVQKALGVLEGTPELPLVLTDPTIPLNRKLAIISQIFSGPDFSPLIASFLKKACEAGCIGQFRDIVSACREHALEEAGVLEASLYYVTEPDEAHIAGIRRFLCRKHQKRDVELTLVYNPELIGGFLLKAGDIEYDYSLKGRLTRLNRAVAG